MSAQAAIWAQSPNLTAITCPQCEGKADQVLNTELRQRTGWYCPACKHYEKAILRERVITQGGGV